jgi:hypothetical protein
MTQGEWRDSRLRTLGIWFGEHGGSMEHLLLLLNSGDSQQTFELPAAPGDGPWIRLFDTALENGEASSLGAAKIYALSPHSIALLEC